jgi:hypothetical protein
MLRGMGVHRMYQRPNSARAGLSAAANRSMPKRGSGHTGHSPWHFTWMVDVLANGV